MDHLENVTQVDFYILDPPSTEGHEHMICNIVEKAWKRGYGVYIYCKDSQTVLNIDDKLWRFKDVSFIPHSIASDDDQKSPVTLSTTTIYRNEGDVFVNLSDEVPESVQNYSRLIDTAGYDDSSRIAARLRFRFYKEQGFLLNTHKIAG